jgi:hypothetical protein
LAARRPVYYPPPDFARCALKRSLVASGPWFRTHPSTQPAIYFSKRSGARFTPEHSPFGVLYAAGDITTSLFEVFGDEMFENDHRIRAFRWLNYSVSKLTIPRVKICNLASPQVCSSLNVELGTLMGQEFGATQVWALAIMEHRAEAHGIVYRSRFTQRTCLALFDRGGTASQVEEELVGSLDNLPEANEFLDQYRCIVV